MAQTETDNLRVAREIVAGSRCLTLPGLMDLAHTLAEENHIGYARRVYNVALSLVPAELHDQVQIKLAFTTAKDTQLPVEERLKTAESLLLDLLSRAESLPPNQHQ